MVIKEIFGYLAHEKPIFVFVIGVGKFLICVRKMPLPYLYLCGAGLPAGGGGLAADPAGAEPGAGAG